MYSDESDKPYTFTIYFYPIFSQSTKRRHLAACTNVVLLFPALIALRSDILQVCLRELCKRCVWFVPDIQFLIVAFSKRPIIALLYLLPLKYGPISRCWLEYLQWGLTCWMKQSKLNVCYNHRTHCWAAQQCVAWKQPIIQCFTDTFPE